MFMDHRIKVGVIPTRRVDMSFALDRALYYKDLVFKKLDEFGVEYVTVEDVCADGILGAYSESEAIIGKMRREKVDALFFVHVNFGCEGAVGQVARALQLPALVWGPRDATGKGGDGDAQCGMFATGKILRRMQTPFTYIATCFVDDPLFKRGIDTFIAAANVVKEFRRARVLQVSTRPESFWSVMCNEGELLEKFGIEIFPISLTELVTRTEKIMSGEPGAVAEVVKILEDRCVICVQDQVVTKSAAMKIALERYAEETRSTCIAIQCWYAMQQAIGIWPCAAGALLNEIGLPAACETDVHGALSCLIADAAAMGREHNLFGDWVYRHPDKDKPNVEYVSHCGISALSIFPEKPEILTRPHDFCQTWGGHVSGWARGGEMTYLRFDGDNGEYSILLGKGRTVEGPSSGRGARVWIEVPNMPKLERHIVKGPYVHHAALIRGDITPIIYEACQYLGGVRPDFPFDEERLAAEDYLVAE